MRLADLMLAARNSVADPRAGFRAVRRLNLSRDEALLALAAVCTLGVLVAEVVLGLMTGSGLRPLLDLGIGPLGSAALQFLLALAMALGIRGVGALAGGGGTLADALAAVAWLQFILLLVQIAQLAALVVLPPLAAILGFVGIGLFFWLLTGFIAELHGFASRWKVFFSLLGCMFLAGVLALPVFETLGLPIPGMQDV